MILDPHQSDEAKEDFEETNSDSEYERKEYQEEFQIQKREKKYQEMAFILGCLKNHFIFYNLSEAELSNVAKKMFYCSVPEEQFIFKEGERAECFFIIEKGMMQVITKDKVKKQLRVGDGFGELALLYKAPRSVSVKAGENCTLWGIDRSTFRKAVEEIITLQYEENRKFMENVRFFSCLANQDKDSITAALIVQRFAKDQTIVLEGDPGSSFYIIKQGSASLMKSNKQIKKLHKGDSFGQQALYYNTIRQMSVKADQDVVCLVLGRETLTNILGDRIFIVTFRNFIKWCFQKHPYFSKLHKAQIQAIIDQMKINYYKSGNIVVKKNSENNSHQKLIVVIQGGLKRSKNSSPFVIKSQFYGEDYLYEIRGKSTDDEILMDTDGILAEIPASNFKQIIGGFVDTVLTKNQKIMIEKQNLQKMNKTKYFQELSEFILIKELRQGVFGPVLLVQHINEKGIFVMKCYNRQKIQELFVEKYIIQEKNLLRDVNSPFVMELYKTFKDARNLYSLIEFVRGEELYDVIRQIGLLSSEDCQFYVATIILILEHFYSNGIIYRDLKPENFIVDMDGFPKLCDLGTAKILPTKGKNFQTLKTYTVIGTPYYMAPQIILAKGYNFTVDLYSLGICMFQFLCGYVPFGEKADDPLKIYEEIVNGEVKYPKYLKDKKAKKLIDQFLSKVDPDTRLGGASFGSLKSNSWFQSINWEQLKQKQFKAPAFDRHPNIHETDQELRRIAKVGINLEDFLNQKYPNRNQGEQKFYQNW